MPLIEEKTGITTMIAEDPLTAVAIGTGKFIEFQHGDKSRNSIKTDDTERMTRRSRVHRGRGTFLFAGDTNMAIVSGYVEKIKYRNEDNGYSVLSVSADGRGICPRRHISLYQ